MEQVSLRERIVEAALALAERDSWEALRLHEIATESDIPLDDIHVHFREKEDIVDAWFDRADAAMLRAAAQPAIAALAAQPRLHRLLMTWFAALAPHRRVTRQMILNKFEPGHLHYILAGALRVSRTVQWWREAAARRAVLPRRAFEETALSAIYLATFARWLVDESADSADTAALLDRLLAGAGRAHAALGGLDRE